MGLTIGPVSLTAEQVDELNRKLSDMRHDINNYLSMMVAAVELIKYNPASAARMTETLQEQPRKISEALTKFSAEFENAVGIARQP